MTASRLRASAGDVERELSVLPDGRIGIGDDLYEAHALGPGAWRLTSGGRSVLAYVAHDTDGLWVHVDGRVHRIEIARSGVRPRRKTSTSEHALSAPMPATVLSILAEIGQAVKTGDTVLMLEAMKMELPVRAPRDGIVTAIHCREGELVQPGANLIDIA